MSHRPEPDDHEGASALGVEVGIGAVGQQQQQQHAGLSMADASTIARTLNDNDEENQGPERLFVILEDAVAQPEDESHQTKEEIQRQRREASDRAWDLIDRWLRAHESREDRAAAASMRGQSDATTLHMMCKLANPPAYIINDMVEAAPHVASWTDRHGWLPLHHACANGASTEVLMILVETYPDGKISRDKQYRTPLHFYSIAKQNNPSSMAVNVRLLSDTGATHLRDSGGMIPMHYACAFGANQVVLKGLAEVYPESVVAVENHLRTPLHLAMVNGTRDAIEFLLSQDADQMVNLRDAEGNLPLHLLIRHAKGLNAETDLKRLNNASECLKLYLAAEPFASPDFLTALQGIPKFLQETAVVSPHVKKTLNIKIVQRFPTSILMLDGYWLLIIIICFEITTTKHIDNRISRDNFSLTDPGTNGELVTLFIGASYFLLREIMQIISLWNLGSVSSWFFDAGNWLDMAVITLVFYYSILMTGIPGIGDNEFRSGIAFTKGVLWAAVIFFLKSTLVDFAVFVGGVQHVVRRLVAFLMAVGVFLLAFSQMFFIEYRQRDECDPESSIYNANGEKFPHCSFDGSLLKTYSMLMGEIGNESRYNNVLVAQFLYVAYAFVVVIVLSNVLIAIVTDSYEVVQNERAAVVFWSNRLDFVAEIQAIRSVVRSLTFCCSRSGRDHDAPMMVKESPNRVMNRALSMSNTVPTAMEESSGLQEYMRSTWAQLMSLLESNFFYDIGLRPNNLEYWFYICYRGVAVLFIIPCWIALGLITVGWLWPPQVRGYLFVQKETAISRAELERQKLEQLREIETAIITLKSDIRKEMAADREDLFRMQNEFESSQGEFLSDLQQVKELMTTLLDLGGGVEHP